MNFEELFDGIAYKLAKGSARDASHFEIEHVTTSPKDNMQNMAFIATVTPLIDGHDLLGTAYDKGCRLFVCEREATLPHDAVVLICPSTSQLLGTLASRVYGYPERKLTLVGITGSVGKSSVALMTAQLLCATGRRAAAIVTDGVFCDGVMNRADAEVPDAAGLRRIFANMCQNGVEYVVLELSAYQLAHGAADGLDFAAVALTDLVECHVGEGEFADFSAYRAAKERLMVARAALAILPVGVDMLTTGRVCRVGEGGDVFAKNVVPDVDSKGMPGVRFTLYHGQEKSTAFVGIPAPFAAQNAVFASCIARSLGLTQRVINARLPRICAMGRLERVLAFDGRQVYIDSAYEACDVSRALDALAPYAMARLSVVVGAVGGRSYKRRALLAHALDKYADFAYLTADDPDMEDPCAICEEIRHAMREQDRCCIIADRKEAIERAVRDMRAGDVLLVTGKGNDETQLIMGVRQPFCEREILRSAVEKTKSR